ncbi:MAG: pseudouridine synthase [Nitrospinota bacterium]|nr:pseudouridine synthase [Nitrospinota bacterium]
MKIRLQKIIAQAGLASRRQAEIWITDGEVSVNGKVEDRLGALADPEKDAIKVGGKLLPASEKKKYLILYKPTLCLTTIKDERNRPTVMELLKKVSVRVFPVGRLDFNTQGLLLFTNDGTLGRKLMDAKNGVIRTYRVKVHGIPTEKDLRRLKKGMQLDNRPTAPIDAKISRVSGKNCFLTLKLVEGKNRHIKRICELIRFPVIKLKRTHFAFLNLNGLNPGEFRYLTAKEVQSLKKLVSHA